MGKSAGSHSWKRELQCKGPGVRGRLLCWENRRPVWPGRKSQEQTANGVTWSRGSFLLQLRIIFRPISAHLTQWRNRWSTNYRRRRNPPGSSPCREVGFSQEQTLKQCVFSDALYMTGGDTGSTSSALTQPWWVNNEENCVWGWLESTLTWGFGVECEVSRGLHPRPRHQRKRPLSGGA